MERLRVAATLYGASRAAYGIGLAAAPRRVARPWLGDGIDSAAAQVGARALGARDAVFGVGIIATVNAKGDPRPWLAACVAGDVADISGTLAVADELLARAVGGRYRHEVAVGLGAQVWSTKSRYEAQVLRASKVIHRSQDGHRVR